MSECGAIHHLLALRLTDRSAEEQNLVEAHLAACPDCAALARVYKEQDRLIRRAPRARLTQAQRGRLLSRLPRERKRQRTRFRLSTALNVATAIAAILIMGLGVYTLMRGSPITPTPTATATATPTPIPTAPPPPTTTPRQPTSTPRPAPLPTTTPTQTITPTVPTATPTPTIVPTLPTATPVIQNLLINPGFEDVGASNIPPGWAVGHLGHSCGPCEELPCEYHRCDEGFISRQPHPEWLRSGEGNLAMIPLGCSSIGVKQVVHNTVPGTTYRFGVWARVWSNTEGGDHTASANPAPIDVWVCIGPYGSQDDLSDPDLNVCSASARPYDTWQYLSVDAVAQEEQIIVRMIVHHACEDLGAAIWDDASLTIAPPPP